MTLPIRNLRMRLTQGQLFWREVGQDQAVVFLHGAWNDGNQWLSVVASLSHKYHCVAPDLLGFGESERPNLHYSIELQVECLAELLETLRLRQVWLVGESVGAWIAATYALRFPDQVRGLVLLSPEGTSLAQPDRWQRERWLTGQPPIGYWILRSLLPLMRLFKQAAGIEKLLQLRHQLRQSPVACRLLFRRRQTEIQAEMLHGDRLQWLKLPVLLLHGDRDPNQTATSIQAFASQAPQTEVHRLPGASNDLPAVQSAEVAAQIDEFIRRHC